MARLICIFTYLVYTICILYIQENKKQNKVVVTKEVVEQGTRLEEAVTD